MSDLVLSRDEVRALCRTRLRAGQAKPTPSRIGSANYYNTHADELADRL